MYYGRRVKGYEKGYEKGSMAKARSAVMEKAATVRSWISNRSKWFEGRKRDLKSDAVREFCRPCGPRTNGPIGKLLTLSYFNLRLRAIRSV